MRMEKKNQLQLNLFFFAAEEKKLIKFQVKSLHLSTKLFKNNNLKGVFISFPRVY